MEEVKSKRQAKVDPLSYYVFGDVMPQAIDVEEYVLSQLITYQNAYRDNATLLHKELFFERKHACVFEAIQSIGNSSDSAVIDMLSVVYWLTSNKNDEKDHNGQKIMWSFFVSSLTLRVAAQNTLISHIGILAEKFALRQMLICTHSVQKSIFTNGDALLCRKMLLDAAEEVKPRGLYDFNIEKASLRAYEFAVGLWAGEVPHCSWGVGALDSKVGRPSRSELVVVAGRPGMGKTTFALHMAYKNAVEGRKVVFFTKEMGCDILLAKLACMISGVKFDRIRKRQASEEEVSKMTQGFDAVSQLSNFVINDQCKSVADIEQYVRSNDDAELVFVDYLQLFACSSNKNTNREREVGEASEKLKGIAMMRDKRIVVALSQLNREGAGLGKVPGLTNLRDSGSIEQDADWVAFLHRPSYYELQESSKFKCSTHNLPNGEAVLMNFAKNRLGETGAVFVLGDMHLGRYDNKPDGIRFDLD